MSKIQIQKLERDLVEKQSQIADLTTQLQQQEVEIQRVHKDLENEIKKRKDLQLQLNDAPSSDLSRHLEAIKSLLREREPNLEQLMELTLKKEKEQQERKDSKILEILRLKDKQMEELQTKLSSQQQQLDSLFSANETNSKKLLERDQEIKSQKDRIQSLLDQQDMLHRQLQMYQNNDSLRAAQLLEQEVDQCKGLINKLQDQLESTEAELIKKEGMEQYYQEAVDRIKVQLEDKDHMIENLSQDLLQFKDSHGFIEECLESMIAQINSVLPVSISSQISSIVSTSRNQESLVIQRSQGILSLVESTTIYVKQIKSQNEDHLRRLSEVEKQNLEYEEKLQSLMEENDDLAEKVHKKVKYQSAQTEIDLHEMEDVFSNFDTFRQSSQELGNINRQLQQERNLLQEKLQTTSKDLEVAKYELSLLAKNYRKQHLAQGTSQVVGASTEYDEVLSKLNAKLTQLKQNEVLLQSSPQGDYGQLVMKVEQQQLRIKQLEQMLQQEMPPLQSTLNEGLGETDRNNDELEEALESNSRLQMKLQELKQAFDEVRKENVILRKQMETERQKSKSQENQSMALRNALEDLETMLVEKTYMPLQASGLQSSKKKHSESTKKRQRSGSTSKNRSQLKFNREESDREGSPKTSALSTIQRVQPNSQENEPEAPRQFIYTPPQIVKTLIQSKVDEMTSRVLIEQMMNNEVSLRTELKDLHQRYNDLELRQRVSSDKQASQYPHVDQSARIMELELEIENLKIQGVQDSLIKLNSKDQQAQRPKQNAKDFPLQDYSLLVESLLSVSTKLAQIEASQTTSSKDTDLLIEEGQRIVIKALISKLSGDNKEIRYVPSDERDRKIWYLELLEQQMDQFDKAVVSLQNFIKKLQIDISGNLQSAAQIKAASMDLAHNTKKAAEEINLLRHISELIKHDLQQISPSPREEQVLQARTINPFAHTQRQTPPFQQMHANEMLAQQCEKLQNALSIAEKVQKSLEKEIVELKMSQAQEMQSLSVQLNQTIEQRDSLLQTNEELHQKILNLESHLDNLRYEIQVTQKDNEENLGTLQQRQKEKELIQKDKVATSKHLNKIQQDMQEWRKQTDENMKLKEKTIQDLTSQVTQIITERDRLKAEAQMLRKIDKERKSAINEDLQKLESENKELEQRLSNMIEERKKEMEFWLTERATMREMIDQLESEKIGLDLNQADNHEKEAQLKKANKKTLLKVKQKKAELKVKEKTVAELKDELSQRNLSIEQLEQKIRELSTEVRGGEDRYKQVNQIVKELELERDMLLVEKRNAISSSDLTAQQISEEMNSLRECFARLKIERDNLLYEINESRNKEGEWRQIVNKMKDEIQEMEKHLSGKEKDQFSQIHLLETKIQAYVQDIKMLKTENERLKSRVSSEEQAQTESQKKILEEEVKRHELQGQINEAQRQINELKTSLKGKEQAINDLKDQLLLSEGNKIRDIQGLRSKLDEVKESNAQIIGLYEGQLEAIKTKLIKEQKKPEQQVDQMFTVAQRDAVVKQLKKENQQIKTQLSKSKTKNKELKSQLQGQENVASNANQTRLGKLKQQKQTIEETIDKGILALAQKLSQQDGYKGLYEQLQTSSEQFLKVAEIEASLSKSENWNMVLSQQMQELQTLNEDLARQVETINQKSQLKESKSAKQSTTQQSDLSVKYKAELKALEQELRQIKQDWISPSDAKLLQDQVKELQQQLRLLKEEVARKRDVINQLKSQREQTEVEASQILQDMEGLKDDNIKLQKLIRENNKNQVALRELKGSNEFLKAAEKRLKEEVAQLNDKVRTLKQDLQRKEVIIRDMKEKFESIQDEANETRDKSGEVDRFKDQARKYKLEVDIKENQVRALKQKLEHTEQELEQLRMNQNQTTLLTSQSNQAEKMSKAKLKKYEGYLKKSLESLRKIGKELTNVSYKPPKSKKKSDNPLNISDLDKEMFKDSVNILGVSMDELEEFMNPGQSSSLSQSASKDNITFMKKLDKAIEIPESLNADLDQICDYCMKLINEIN